MNNKEWEQRARDLLVGRTIKEVRYTDAMDDDMLGVELVLDNGAHVYVMQDDEGNGPGALYMEGDDSEETILPRLRHERR